MIPMWAAHFAFLLSVKTSLRTTGVFLGLPLDDFWVAAVERCFDGVSTYEIFTFLSESLSFAYAIFFCGFLVGVSYCWLLFF